MLGRNDADATAHADRFLANSDEDGNGTVDYDEFIAFICELFDEDDDDEDIEYVVLKTFFPNDFTQKLKS